MFIDAVRLLAVLQMINGHTLDAILAPEVRAGSAFQTYSFCRGLVSVAFLVVAGMAFYITRVARGRAAASDGQPLWPRIRRALMLLGTGYFIRFPFYAFLGGERAAVAFHVFFAVDVLAAVAVALLLLEAIVRLCRSPAGTALASAAAGAALFAAAPLAERITPAGPWKPLLDYLSHRAGSSFPILPWSGYVLLGVAAAYVAFPDGASASRRALVGRIGGLSLVALAAALALSRSPLSLWHPGLAYASMPSFAVLKLAAVLALVGASALLLWGVGRLPRPLAILSEETLFIYVFHHLVLFWPPITLESRIGRTLDLAPALAVAAAMIAVSTGAAFAWRLTRRGHDVAWPGWRWARRCTQVRVLERVGD